MNEHIQKLKDNGYEAFNEKGVLMIMADYDNPKESKRIKGIMKDYKYSYGIRYKELNTETMELEEKTKEVEGSDKWK